MRQIQINTTIALWGLVPTGTENAAFNLLSELGTMTIQTPQGEMMVVTRHEPITVNGIDFNYCATSNQVIVRDIENKMVGKASHGECTTYIDLVDEDGFSVNDLHEQTDQHVAQYIAAISFN